MIYLYSGTPGSGKSLHSATVIYWTLKRGLPVIANFPIALDKIQGNKLGDFVEVSNDKLSPDFLIDYSYHYFAGKRVREDEILLVIDECQLLFNSRDWNAKGRSEWLSFFSQHRHYGYAVILVAQFDRMIDRHIRSLIEYEQIHRKLSNFGWKGKILSLLMGGKVFVSVKVWYPMKEKVSSDFFRAHKKYYSLYDTYGNFSTDGGGTLGGPPESGEKLPDSGSAEEEIYRLDFVEI